MSDDHDALARVAARAVALRDAREAINETAASHSRSARSHYVAILGTLWRLRIPPEIARLTGLTVEQVERRREQMIERGAIKLTGVERDGYAEWDRA